MKCSELFNTIEKLNDKYMRVWEEVCNIESPTTYKAGVDAVGEYFIKLAKEMHWQVEVLECETAGNAVLITMNPDAKGKPIVFSGHIDTVHPVGLFGTPAVKKQGDKLIGPGVTDCKGGVVASVMAMEALMLQGFKSRPIKLILQSDEETGSKTSGKKTVEFMCERSKGAEAFFNTEPTSGNIAILTRKGIARYCFHVKGVAAHSAKCPEGSSAILEAASKIMKLEKYKDLDGITCNCGVIKGGTTPNTVAAECDFFADIRFVDVQQFDEVQEIVKNVANTIEVNGCSCKLEQISYRPAMKYTAKNQALLDVMNKIYAENEMPTLNAAVGHGGSDAAYITEAGIPCVDSIGVDGGNIHSKDEFAYVRSLLEAAKRLAAVAYCI